MRLQSAIFDLDGTLLDSMPRWNQVGPEVLRSLGVELRPEIQERVKVLTLEEGAALCREAYGLRETVEDLSAEIRSRMGEFYRSGVRPKPGVEKFLSLLKMEGVWMYVATNTDRPMVETALAHAGIERYFRGIVTCAEAGAGKNDSPEVFERALRRLQSSKKDTVVFEDALHAIQTAKRAGFRVAGVYDPSAEADQEEIRNLSDYYIRSFEEMYDAENKI